MVEELKIAIKVDDDSVEQSLLKQFANAQKMADKVVLDFKNVNFDDKEIEARFKALQKKAGQNPIDLSISKDSIQMLSQISDKLGDIFKIAHGKSIIDSSSTNADIGKIENKLNELTKKYEDLQKKASGGISGKEVNLVDNDEFKKLSANFEKIKGEVDDLKTHMNLLSDSTVSGDSFLKLSSQVDGLSVKLDGLLDKYVKLSNAQKNIGVEPNISSGMKDAFQNKDVSVSVQKTTEAIKEQNSVLEENTNRARESVNELIKGRDIISQQWYKEKDTVVGKDSKGNNITRDVNQFSFVERLQNGQIQTVVATLDEKTGQWVEQIVNARTAFEQVEKAIISADNKINSLKNSRDKTLATHPGYDATADNNLIKAEQKHRNELQKTLDVYATEKEYAYQIEAANKRIAENQQRLQNVSVKQNNLQQIKNDENAYNKQLKIIQEISAQKKQMQELDRKTDVDIAFKNQLTAYKEIQNLRYRMTQTDDSNILSELERQKKIYQEQYLTSTKILKNNSDLYNSEKRLNELKQIGLKTTLKIAESQAKATSQKSNSLNEANANSLKAIWDKNVQAIQKYMDAVSELNRRKTIDKGTGKDAEYIAAQEKEVERLKAVAKEARTVLSSMVNPHNADISTWKKWVSTMEQFSKASQGSADSVAKLKDALRNANEAQNKYISSAVSKHQGYLGEYKSLINNIDYLSTNNFREKVATYESELKKLQALANELKGQEFISKGQSQSFDEMVQKCQNARKALQGMNASDKGAWAVDVQKEIDKINSDLMKNTKYSAEAQQKLRGFIDTLKAGNISDTTLKKIHEEFLKITNAEKLAGRAGQSFFDIFKTKSVYGFIGQMQSYLSMYVGFYGMVNGIRNAVSTIVQLDDALVDLKKTTAMSSSELENFYYDSNDVAKQMGVTTQAIIEQSSAWSRLGFSSAEASTQMSKLSAQFAAISPGMDIDTATDGLVSTMKAFDIDVQDVQREVMDNINKIGNTAATSNDEIVDMLTRSSAAMSAANNTLEETIALETAAVEITRSAETTGTAFKTLSMRLRGYDEQTESYSNDVEQLSGDIADLTKTASTPGGISLFTDETKQTYKSTYELLKEISQIYDQLSDKTQADFCLYVQKCA